MKSIKKTVVSLLMALIMCLNMGIVKSDAATWEFSRSDMDYETVVVGRNINIYKGPLSMTFIPDDWSVDGTKITRTAKTTYKVEFKKPCSGVLVFFRDEVGYSYYYVLHIVALPSVNSITCSESDATVEVGKKLDISKRLKVTGLAKKSVGYKISSSDVASVSSSGVVTAKKAGKANLYVYVRSNGTQIPVVTFKIPLTVKKKSTVPVVDLGKLNLEVTQK